MKLSNFSKFVGASVITASLAVMSPLGVQAQDAAPNTTTEPGGAVEAVDNENDTDWGWLGLLGLAGLAGLAGKKRREPVHTETTYRDPNDLGVPPTSDYRR